MEKKKISRIFALSATLLFTLWALGFLGFLVVLNQLGTSPSSDHTEAIIVLTGGPKRINTGLDLLNEGSGDILFVTGVDERVTAETLFSLWQEQSQRPSLPCCLVLDHKATNTAGNAHEAAIWVLENKITSLRLVTSLYHMPRAWLEFRTALPEQKILIHPVADHISKKAFGRLAFAEYNKTILTYLHRRLIAPRLG